ERVYAIARNPQRAAVAQALGAYGIIARSAGETKEEMLAVTPEHRADVVVECTAQPRVGEATPFFARPGGPVVLFGGCPSGTTAAFDTYRLHYDQVRILSPFHFTPKAVRRAYELLASRKILSGKLLSGIYPLAQLPYAFDLLQRGEGIKYAII